MENILKSIYFSMILPKSFYTQNMRSETFIYIKEKIESNLEIFLKEILLSIILPSYTSFDILQFLSDSFFSNNVFLSEY